MTISKTKLIRFKQVQWDKKCSTFKNKIKNKTQPYRHSVLHEDQRGQ